MMMLMRDIRRIVLFFFSSRRRHTRYISVTGVQTCALPILLQAQFQFAVLDIFDYLEGRVYDDTPADEILAAADLIAWDLRPGFLKIQVRLTTAAGDSRDYIVPVPVAAG